MILILLACSQKETDSPSGAELVTEYSSAYCDVYAQEDCGFALAGCGSPAMGLDWDSCMDVQQSQTNQCVALETFFLENQSTVQSCTDALNKAADSCAAEDLCPDGTTIFEEGPCATILTQIEACL